MIVVNKKKIIWFILGIVIFVFFIILIKNNKETNYVSTVSLPVSGKTIVIDAGHGVPDE